MVMWLVLPSVRLEARYQIAAQESCRKTLVGTVCHPHPNEMKMIGHQRIDRTDQLLSYRGV